MPVLMVMRLLPSTSSAHTLADQSPTCTGYTGHHWPDTTLMSPTERKFLLKAGLRWRPRTGPWWPRKVLMITSGCTFAFLEQHTILPSSVPTWPHQNTTRNIPPVVPHHVSGGDGGVVLEDAGGEGPLPHPLAPGVLVIRVQDRRLHRGGEPPRVPPLR